MSLQFMKSKLAKNRPVFEKAKCLINKTVEAVVNAVLFLLTNIFHRYNRLNTIFLMALTMLPL